MLSNNPILDCLAVGTSTGDVIVIDGMTGALLKTYTFNSNVTAFSGLTQPASAEIHGTKWDDLNANGVRDEGEPGLPGWTIYLDQNRNGQWDDGEPHAITDASGDYVLSVADGLVVGQAVPAPGFPNPTVNELLTYISPDGQLMLTSWTYPGNVGRRVWEPQTGLWSDREQLQPTGTNHGYLSPDGNTMYLNYAVPVGGEGNIYRSNWDGNGWSAPEPVPNVDTPTADHTPAFNGAQIYWTRLYDDLWVADYDPASGQFSTSRAVDSINTSEWAEEYAWVSSDGRLLVFSSNRPGGYGGYDLWYATRNDPLDDWGNITNFGPNVNTGAGEGVARIAEDAGLLFFTRDGEQDIQLMQANVGYAVREVLQPGWAQTFPDNAHSHQVVVTPGQVVAGIDFGNHRPTAEAGGPYTGNEGSDITLDGSASTDGANDIVSYEWDLDNDGEYDDAVGAAATFHAIDDGVYPIGLRVTDALGAWSVDTATVAVNEVPVEIIVGDHTLLPNQPDQRIPIWVQGGRLVTGLNLRGGIGDGSGGVSEPVFSGAEFAGGIWDPYPTTALGGPVSGLQQFLQASVVFNETGRSVPADGVIAWLIVDTTGFDEGQFDLRLAGTEIGVDSVFLLAGGVELPVSIRNGSITIAPAEVVGSHLFYNDSGFDNHDSAANANDDQAIAADKLPLRPGERATFANYTSYIHGINGIMVDVARLPAVVLDAASFEFRVGNTQKPSSWLLGPAPESISVRRGAGVGGSDRVTLIWPDGAIVGCWLQVTVLATAETGLALSHVFYFGNAPGESGNSPGNTYVDATDFAGVRDNPRDFLHRATIDSVFDFNRDTFVDGTDLAVVRDHATNFVTALILLDLGGGVKAGSGIVPGSWGFKSAFALLAPAGNADPVEADSGLAAAGRGLLPEGSPGLPAPLHPCDVDRNGRVTPDDAMAIVNFIATPAVADPEPCSEYDVNGDQFCTPLDALLVINRMAAGAEQAAEGEGGADASGLTNGDPELLPGGRFGTDLPHFATAGRRVLGNKLMHSADCLRVELDTALEDLADDIAQVWNGLRW